MNLMMMMMNRRWTDFGGMTEGVCLICAVDRARVCRGLLATGVQPGSFAAIYSVVLGDCILWYNFASFECK